MNTVWPFYTLAACLGMSVVSWTIAVGQSPQPLQSARVSFNPMSASEKSAFLASHHSKKNVSGGMEVFSTTRLKGSGSDGLLFSHPYVVDGSGAEFKSEAGLTGANVYLQYTPKAKGKSHLVVATVVATRGGSITFQDAKTHQNTVAAVAAGKTGHLALIEPEGAAYFGLWLTPQDPKNMGFVFKQISIEELR